MFKNTYLEEFTQNIDLFKMNKVLMSDQLILNKNQLETVFKLADDNLYEIDELVQNLYRFKKYQNDEINILIKNLTSESKFFNNYNIIETISKIEISKNIKFSEKLNFGNDLIIDLTRYHELNKILENNVKLYESWYLPNKDMFVFDGLGVQFINAYKKDIAKKFNLYSNKDIALIKYWTTSDGYIPVNKALGGKGIMTPELQIYANNLKIALYKGEKFEGIVYRGLPINVDKDWIASRYVKGNECTEPIFFATSVDIQVAEARRVSGNGNVLYEVYSNSKGTNINTISEAYEKEVLFPFGSKFDVLSVELKENGCWLIKLKAK